MNELEISIILKDEEYVKGKPTTYYILTIKNSMETKHNCSLRYDVIVLENSKIIEQAKVESSTERQLLTPAKKKGVQLLLENSSHVTPEMVTMVHYKARPNSDPWQKESSSVLQMLFKEVRTEFINYTAEQDIDSEKAQEDSYYKDGSAIEYFGTRYERNPLNRAKAIEIHGVICKACCFNFERVYGIRGKDYIEVHHIKPLSTNKGAADINPETDLVPLCSNCHRMIHRKKDDILTLNGLKKLMVGPI